MKSFVLLIPLFLALSSTYGAETCYAPAACNTWGIDSNFRVWCNKNNYNANPRRLPAAFFGPLSEATECRKLFDRAGDPDKNGRQRATYECGKSYKYDIDYYSKGQPLPYSEEVAEVKITIGGVEVTVPVKKAQWCNLYTPIVDKASEEFDGECGGQALTNGDCRI